MDNDRGPGMIRTLYRFELKMLLRDKRTLFFSVLLPLIVLPGYFIILGFIEDRAEERRESATYEYAVVGERTDEARALIGDALTLRDDTLQRLVEEQPADPDSALATGEVDFLVEAFSTAEAQVIRDSLQALEEEDQEENEGEDSGESDGAAAEDDVRVPMIEIRYRANNDASESGADVMRDVLQELRDARRSQIYREAGLPVDPGQVAALELDEAASAEEASGAMLALWLTPLLVLLMLSGGSIVAVDTLSGEKERGTLETLLTSSARRRDIVWAKQLLIITTGITITLINVLDLAVLLGLGLFDVPDDFVISVSPSTVVVLLLLFLPLTVFISSVLLILSGYAKGYKEYQISFLPVMLIFLLPSAAAVLPGLELASVVSVIPIANISVASREVLTGEFNWLFLGITIASTVGIAAWLAAFTEKTLSTEKLVTAAETDEADLMGGPALFPKRVLRWFAVLWAALFLIANWFESGMGIRGQITINVIGLFGGATLLMLWRYRLDPRKALALRMPKPAVWPAVLIGAPSALIVGAMVGQLSQLIFPVSDRVIEAFGQYLVEDQLPLWQIVVFMTILPGIFEELAFRGVLLHGIRRRFKPWMVALIVGGIFGFFHISIFRILPTGYLGVVLASVTLLTGSIFPAMLWHTLNNAVAIVPSQLGWLPEDLELAWWVYVMAVAGLAVSGWVIWRNRTVYPGLRGSDDDG